MRCYFKGVARDGSGNIIVSASVTVYEAGTTTAASIYTSLTSTTAVNSVSASSNGSFEFWVSRFDYDSSKMFKLVISASGYMSVTWDNIIVDQAVLGTYTISTDTTVSTQLYTPKGVIYSIATGVTLTINGPFEAGLYQAFSCMGTGKVAFGDGSIVEAFPEWFADNTTPGTTDMTAAIQSALNAHSNVALLYTTYATDKIVLNTGNNLYGKDPGRKPTVKMLAAGTGDVLYINAKNNVRIENLVVDRNAAAAAGNNGINIYKSSYVTLKGVEIKNATSYSGITSTGDGVLRTDNAHIDVIDCVSHDNAHGISVQGSSNVLVRNLHTYSNTSTGTSGGLSQYVTFDGVRSHDNGADGITMGADSQYISIINSTSYDNAAEGLNLDGCRYSKIENNISYNNLIGAAIWNTAGTSGAVHDNSIIGNVLDGNSTGVIVGNVISRTLVTANKITRSGTKSVVSPGAIGIVLGAITDVTVTSNNISYSLDNGIQVQSVIGGLIANNNIHNNAREGIQFTTGSGTARIIVNSNKLTSNGDGVTYVSGILINGGANVGSLEIDGNYFVEETGVTNQLTSITSNASGGIITISNNSCFGINNSYPALSTDDKHFQRNNSWQYANTAPTTGRWMIGDTVYSTNPSSGNPSAWTCTTSGVIGSGGVFKPLANLP